MIAGIFSWLVGKAMALAGSRIVRGALDIYNKAQGGAVRLAEIDAQTGQVLGTASIAAGNERQAAKMSWPVFWVIIVVMLGAPAWQLWGVTLYNTFWHANGIWPQGWNIAAYPPSVAPWVEKSIDWLYDPVGVPGTVLSAWFAGRAVAKK